MVDDLWGEGSSGSFSYSLVVPDNVNKITLDSNGDVIWRRDGTGLYQQEFVDF